MIVSFCSDRLAGVLLYKSFLDSFCPENYAFKKCDADIVILGSSRARHHYVPSIISDSLGLSCYNLGENGKNIYYQFANLNLLLTHQTPKLIIYDCFSVDVMKADFKYDFGSLSDLYPVYGKNNVVDSMIEMQGTQYTSRILVSHVYRYNSRFLDHLLSRSESGFNGYDPLSGTYKKDISVHEENEKLTIDHNKIHFIDKLIQTCREKNIAIIIAVSPRYALNENDNPITKKYEVVRDLCDNNNVPFLYYELDDRFLSNGQLFKDVGHLNNEGARLFTQIFAHDLKEVKF